MVEVGIARTFHALHRLEEHAGPATHEHEHTYRVEAAVRGETLPESGMLLDLDVLGRALSECLAELDASDLDALPAFAGRPTTVEIVSEHIWDQVRDRIGRSESLRSLRVTVYESADAWASVDRLTEA